MRRLLVTGATGFVGRSLVEALLARGQRVRATTRGALPPGTAVEWVRCDVSRRADLDAALADVDTAFFLVHGMGGGAHDYAAQEERSAREFAAAAAAAGVRRIVYLGGVAPSGLPSVHLRSRLRVGEVLREGPVPTLELRASVIIGPGSASWQIIRDLAQRLPVMLLPSWTSARTCPIALDDVIIALQGAIDLPLDGSAWFDIPGPEALSGAEIMMRIARLQGRAVPALPVPLLSVSLSSWWLRLVTRADFSLARELVLGFTSDLLPRDDRYWGLIDAPPRTRFDDAARRALAAERPGWAPREIAAAVEESLVAMIGRRIARRAG